MTRWRETQSRFWALDIVICVYYVWGCFGMWYGV